MPGQSAAEHQAEQRGMMALLRGKQLEALGLCRRGVHRLPCLWAAGQAVREEAGGADSRGVRSGEALVKSLKEMPGPRTLTNLVEFFWRDGFGRIHEIQVMGEG